MKPKVSLRAVADYRRETLETEVAQLLAPLGGISAFVRPGQRVLVKPNLLSAKGPDKAVTTHPELVRAVVRLAQQAGGVISVGDSPGIGTPRQVARACGILQVCEETGASFAPFADSDKIRPRGSTFQELEIARDIVEADVIINLPKLKTHQMMGVTCAVKNLFGAVVGLRKPRLHLQAGTSKAFFALMLLELAEQIAPALNIVDAVIGMEGNGPGSGDPVQIGALLAGADALAVDAVALALLGLPTTASWTQQVARQSGRSGSILGEVEVFGPEPASLRPVRFRPAKATDVNFGLPDFLKNPLKRSLTALPAVDRQQCTACGLCAQHCPPSAMQVEGKKLQIDLQNCIGCFCCQELCPRNAILTHQGLLLRLNRFLSGRQP